jgi:spermidine synthase
LNKDRAVQNSVSAPVYIAIALSGLSALGAEVVWTRLLSVLFGTTAYSFSIILAVFLLGLGTGSWIGSRLARTTARPQLIFGFCQLLLTALIAWTAWAIAKWLPYWPIDSALAPSPWINFQLDVFRALWAVLPATLLWGASFPLALASLPRRLKTLAGLRRESMARTPSVRSLAHSRFPLWQFPEWEQCVPSSY